MTQRSFTQELRLQSNQSDDSRFSYVFGVFYQKLRQTVSERDRAVVPEVFSPNIIAPLFGLPVGFPIPITEPDGAFTVAFDESIDEQYAAFTNLDYKLTDKLTAQRRRPHLAHEVRFPRHERVRRDPRPRGRHVRKKHRSRRSSASSTRRTRTGCSMPAQPKASAPAAPTGWWPRERA